MVDRTPAAAVVSTVVDRTRAAAVVRSTLVDPTPAAVAQSRPAAADPNQAATAGRMYLLHGDSPQSMPSPALGLLTDAAPQWPARERILLP